MHLAQQTATWTPFTTPMSMAVISNLPIFGFNLEHRKYNLSFSEK